MMLHVDPFGGYHYILDGSTHQTVEMIPMIEMFIWTKFQEPDARVSPGLGCLPWNPDPLCLPWLLVHPVKPYIMPKYM